MDTLQDYGASLISIPGIDTLFSALEDIEFNFSGEKGPCASPTWLMEEKHINTPSSNKKSYFMFDPIGNPGHFGSALADYVQAICSMDLVKKEIEQKGLRSAAGIHYYGYSEEETSPSLGQHNDVNWWSIINTNGPISMWTGKWTSFSKNANDNPEVLLAKDQVIVMTGLSRALIEGGSPVLHKVDEVKRRKFTVGIFLELADKTVTIKTPEGRELTVEDFTSSYFGVTEQTRDVYLLKHEYVKI